MGPKWLCLDKSSWPNGLSLEKSVEVTEEKKKTSVLSVTASKVTSLSQVIDVTKFSTHTKLLNVTAYVCRFVHNLKAKKNVEQKVLSQLTVLEILSAEKLWIVEAQNVLRNEAKFKLLSQQLGLVEDQGILRCRGRLSYSDLQLNSKFPIILSQMHKFTELVILWSHAKVGQEGLRGTLAEVRSRYWITKGRQFVKKVIRHCVICKKLEGKAYKAPPMGPLPDFRVTQSPAFSKVGIDFA